MSHAKVVFEIERTLPLSPGEAWERLVDWPGHGDWVPMTRVEVDATDPSRFVAWSGVGPLTLEDRMRVAEQHFDGESGACRVVKVGPVLTGEASFTVQPGAEPDTAVVVWREDVAVPHLPQFLSPVAAAAGKVLFGWSLKRMAR
jgi:hypothetical protein